MNRALVLLTVTSVAAASSSAQAPASATVTLRFENAALSPAAYVLTIAEDGTGHYHSDPNSTTVVPPGSATAQPLDQDIHISPAVRQQIFSLARSHQFFGIQCEAPKSKVAFSGKKTLSYSGPDGSGSCSYNYARDPQLNKLAETAFAISNTIEIGRMLRFDLQYDHLGLDASLESLNNYVKDGRAIELGNIAPELTAIEQDPGMLSRARARAHALLEKTTP